MEPALLLTYAITCVLLAFAPGVDIFFVLSSSLSSGFKTGFAITLGLCSGVVVHTLLCAAGVSMVVASSPALLNCVRILGAAYLGYLAYVSFKTKPAVFSQGGAAARVNFKKLWARGFAMNVSNPKVIIFFLSFFPQFITRGGLPAWAQISVLGAIFMASALACFSLVAYCADRAARVFASLLFAKIMRWASVLVFGGLAALLFCEIF